MTQSNVTINGNNNLKNKSVITITVVAEDSTVSTYAINIEKTNNKDIILLSIIAIIFIILVMATIYLIIIRKKDS